MEKFKKAPIMTSLGIVILLSTGVTAGVNLTGFWDKAHVTHEEIAEILTQYPGAPAVLQQIAAASSEREDIRRESRCQSLQIRIAIVEQAIWQMENAGQNTQRLVEKRRELVDLETQYRTLRCSSV